MVILSPGEGWGELDVRGWMGVTGGCGMLEPEEGGVDQTYNPPHGLIGNSKAFRCFWDLILSILTSVSKGGDGSPHCADEETKIHDT